MRQKEIAAKECGVSNCLIPVPALEEQCRVWFSVRPRQEEGCASWLAPLLVDRVPHTAQECPLKLPFSLPCSGNNIWLDICMVSAGALRGGLVAN